MWDTQSRFLVGLALALSNSLLSSFGFILQRKAQLLNEKSPCEEPYQRRHCLWAFGVALYILAALPDVVAYALIPQVVCTTVACFRLVLATFLAHKLLGEKVERRAALGMAACSIGTALCLVCGPRSADIGTTSWEGGPHHPHLWTYLGVTLGLLVALLVIEHSEWARLRRGLRGMTLPLATGLGFAVEKVLNTELGFIRAPQHFEELLQAHLWCCMAASVGVLGLVDLYLNLRGAATMRVQLFLPLTFAFGTTLQFFQSAVIFNEFAELTQSRMALSGLGAVLALIGALLIQPPLLGSLGSKSPDVELGILSVDAGRSLNPTP
mmetsp:Transcript_16502/g.47857  ORF Transcript_16502/g.47857 Transcript_16502/m.47857 type:complete len:324 (-) Transcript_16502:194-1165(-)|eukprot:CAMPEP_0176098814 /NCGR_PEP_ID=MMETSP0120_2-20121206/49550_1 /TAXON_ID=160619 /ORGANISM="Kryptoperidinium foliaceum, Strain CCMP 1326" /LENGTH=323 /DNA_ID=CAMNT_0017432833 /DNA_START=14 /DNA_END=985 /DNA_ORIENTATION=-